jgi:hypothetical protein
MFTTEEVKKAMRIYYFLLENGELTNKTDQELYRIYNDDNIQHLLEIIASETESKIRKLDDTIYLIPYIDNEFLGYKRSELKKEIFNRVDCKNLELYLGIYIIIIIILEFYSGEGLIHKIRDSISIGEIDQVLHERLEPFRHHQNDEASEQSHLKISDMADMYFEALNEDGENPTRTRRWYINCVIRFLAKQELLMVQDETILIPTIKFDRIVKYTLDLDNLETIRTILNDAQTGGEDSDALLK